MLVAVTVTVRGDVEITVELDGGIVADCALLALESSEGDNVEEAEDEASEEGGELDADPDAELVSELEPLDALTPGTVRVPRLSNVTATSDVGAAIWVVVLPSLMATSRMPAVTVTSGARGRMILPGVRC